MTVEEALKWADRWRSPRELSVKDVRNAHAFSALADEIRRLRLERDKLQETLDEVRKLREENRIAEEAFQMISRDCDRIIEGLKSLSLMDRKEMDDDTPGRRADEGGGEKAVRTSPGKSGRKGK